MLKISRRYICLMLLTVGLTGCAATQVRRGGDELKTPDERAAITWISRAFHKKNVPFELGRTVQIAPQVPFKVTLSATGQPWHVLWLRIDQQQELKGKLTVPAEVESNHDALWVHPGVGPDQQQRILIIREQDFQYDPDPSGTGVVRSIQEVEARVVRDVSDFLVRATSGNIP